MYFLSKSGGIMSLKPSGTSPACSVVMCSAILLSLSTFGSSLIMKIKSNLESNVTGKSTFSATVLFGR